MFIFQNGPFFDVQTIGFPMWPKYTLKVQNTCVQGSRIEQTFLQMKIKSHK
jgi:hypothetical protein